MPAERWLAIAEAASPGALEILAEIMGRQIAPERISLEAAARLAAARPLPLARLGLGWLKARTPASDDERRGLLALLEAACEPLRPEILAWLRSVLAATPEFRADWLLEFLDSRHADARAEGMSWFREEARARDDVVLWQRLMESPYDDVRLALAADLDARLKRPEGDVADLSLALDPERLRLLWASVLLNVQSRAVGPSRGSSSRWRIGWAGGPRRPRRCCRCWRWACDRSGPPSAARPWPPWSGWSSDGPSRRRSSGQSFPELQWA